jgi:multidrug efflux pump subunit AcrA (membrane-fusion protein)
VGEALDPTTRTIQARVELPNAAGLLKPEMYGTADIAAGASQPGMFVPQAAVQELNGQPTVFVKKEGGRFEPRRVETGRTLDGRVEIRAGVRAGDVVVTKGSFLLKSQMLKSTMGE